MDILEIMKKEMLRRGYSHKTIVSYIFWVKKFINKNHKDLRKFSKKDVREYLDFYIQKDASGSTINTIHAALRFMMVEVLRKSLRLNIRYSKIKKKVPRCLTVTEVRSLIDSISNPKHKILIELLYGTGLRVSEVVSLRKEDLNLSKGFGWINGKGGRERPFIIPNSLQSRLASFPEGYLFPGRFGVLTVRSVQEILKKASKKTKMYIPICSVIHLPHI